MRQCIRILKKHTVDEARKEILGTLLDANAPKDKKIAAKILYMLDSDFANDGGPGSGNWGHKGRPGLRGGSGKGGGSHYRGGSAETGFESTRKDWTKGLSQEDRTKISNLFGKRSSGAGADNPEKQIMLSTVQEDKKEYLGLKGKARKWDERAGLFTTAFLSDEEQTVYKYLRNKYSGNTPDSNTEEALMSKMDPDELKCYLDLKSKALEGPDSGEGIPDEIAYSSGIKQRPVQKRAIPKWIFLRSSSAIEFDVKDFASVLNIPESRIKDVNSPKLCDDLSRIAMSDLAAKKLKKPAMKKLASRISWTSGATSQWYFNSDVAQFKGGLIPNIKGLTAKESKELVDIVYGQQGLSSTYSFSAMCDYLVKHPSDYDQLARYTELLYKKMSGEDVISQAEADELRADVEANDLTAISTSSTSQSEIDARIAKVSGERKRLRDERASGKDMRDTSSQYARVIGKHYDQVTAMVDKCSSKDTQCVWDMYHYKVRVGETDSTRQYYLPSDKRIYINTDRNSKGDSCHYAGETTIHETGHAIDQRVFKDYYEGSVTATSIDGGYFSSAFEDGAFPDALEKDAREAVKKYEDEAEKMIQTKSQAELRSMYPMLALSAKKGIITKKDLGRELIVRKFNKEKLKYSVVSDMMQGATKNKVRGSVGHSRDYYTGNKRRENLATEAFAEMYSRTLIGKDIDVIKEFFPTAHSVFERMMKKIGG